MVVRISDKTQNYSKVTKLLVKPMDYISVREVAQKWEISERRVQKLCEESRINGIQKFGRSWK